MKEENSNLRTQSSDTTNTQQQQETHQHANKKQAAVRVPWNKKELLRLAYCYKEYRKKDKADMWVQAIKLHSTWFVQRTAKSLANKYRQNKNKEDFKNKVKSTTVCA